MQTPSFALPRPLNLKKRLDLGNKVFGWHPYWASSGAYQSYDYTILTHISWFSYETDTLTGGYKTINGWDQTPVIDYAHARGVKVVLTVTNFGSAANKAILRDTLKQVKMFQTLVTLLKSRNGDGVNFDLETVGAAYRLKLVDFMKRAVRIIKGALPGSEISMATPAVDWNGSWDLQSLSEICDYLIVMGYDYFWSSSPTAGPVAPLAGESYNVTRTVDTYLAAGVPASKLLLGIPWYGYNWPVNSLNRKATAIGVATAVTSVVAESLSANYGKLFDQTTKVPWFGYKDASNVFHQIWYDDLMSYGYKFELVKSRKMAGIGIWALSYENGKKELWGGIQSSFSTTSIGDISVNHPDNFRFSVFPNPVAGSARIQFFLSEPRSGELIIAEISGKQISRLFSGIIPAGDFSLWMDCSSLKNGFYLVVFKTQTGNLTRKFVVENN
jgi:spore germination protein YaaH